MSKIIATTKLPLLLPLPLGEGWGEGFAVQAVVANFATTEI